MCTNVAALCKASTTLSTLVWALASVATHMSLQVTKLRKGKVAPRKATDLGKVSARHMSGGMGTAYIGLVASMCPPVNVQMGFLCEALVAAGSVADVSFYLAIGWPGGAGVVAGF